MDYQIVTLSEKVLVGLTAETGNNDPQMGAIIGGLWQDFYQKGIVATVKNKVNAYAIGLYSDYVEDRYLVTVGNEVSQGANPELSTKIIPAGKYAKFEIEGDMQAVADAWEVIWQMDEFERTYTGDFEEYLNADLTNAKIDIYIAIK